LGVIYTIELHVLYLGKAQVTKEVLPKFLEIKLLEMMLNPLIKG